MSRDDCRLYRELLFLQTTHKAQCATIIIGHGREEFAIVTVQGYCYHGILGKATISSEEKQFPLTRTTLFS